MAEEQMCVCGHAKAAHQHFRPGSDCGSCGVQKCPEFRRDKRAERQLKAREDPAR
ncbi:hypothetical protein [Amycolatopsis nigrescens]|uniref:hypothetical protein n=1 Tax=Amycolatopsis nigrescens TaxID=381445 RepID=UPI0012FA140B|nr:hypothetical protein [Amycolatopsis nigrescens]